MKKINIKIFNISLWITLILAYVLPAQKREINLSCYGYPLAFLTVPNSLQGNALILSLGVNLLYLVFNIMILYIIISIGKKVVSKL